MTSLIFPLIILAFIAISKLRVPISKSRPAIAFYLAVLLVAVPLYYAVAQPNDQLWEPDPEAPEPDESFWDEMNRQINDFYNAAFEQRLHEYEKATIVAEKTLTYDGDSIVLTAPGFEYYNTTVLIERKDTRDGTLEIIVYEADIPYAPAPTNPPDFAVRNDTLQILAPQQITIEEIRFYHDFTMSQFSGRGLNNTRSHMFIGESQVIVIRVPQNLTVETDRSTEYSIMNMMELEPN